MAQEREDQLICFEWHATKRLVRLLQSHVQSRGVILQLADPTPTLISTRVSSGGLFLVAEVYLRMCEVRPPQSVICYRDTGRWPD